MRWGDRTAALVVVLSAATGLASGYALSMGRSYAEEAVLPPELTPPPFRLPGGGRLVGVPYAPEGTRLDPLSPAVIRWAAAVEARPDGPGQWLARGYLAAAQGRFKEAQRLIEKLSDEVTSAAVLSDQAAIELALAASADEPLASARALDHAVAATLLRGGDARLAQFNVARALETIHLPEVATEAWGRYLDTGPVDPWREEALQRLAGLRALTSAHRARMRVLEGGAVDELAAAAAASTTDARNYFFDTGLGLLADSLLREPPRERLLAVARAVEHSTADRLLVDIAACAPGAAYLAGLESLRAARRFHVEFDLDKAIQHYEAARQALRPSCPSLEARTRIWLGVALMQKGRRDEALAVSALDEVAIDRYPTLEAWRSMLLGWSKSLAGDDGAAIAHYRRATGFVEAQDWSDATWVAGSISNALSERRDHAAAWREQIEANQLATRAQDPKYLNWVLEYSATTLGRLGASHAALLLLGEFRRKARASGDPLRQTQAAWFVAEVAMAAGQPAIAQQALSRARPLLAEVSDPNLRRNEEAYFGYYEALAATRKDPSAAVEKLGVALARAELNGNRSLPPWVLLHRAEALHRLGRIEAAVGDWSRSALAFREQRRLLREAKAPDRLYFEGSHELYEGWVGALWETGKRREAIGVAESSRALGLLDALPDRQDAGAEARSPPPTLHVEQLSNKLILALQTSAGAKYWEVPWTRTETRATVRAALRAVEDGHLDAATEATLRRASHALIEPAASTLAETRALLILPDADWEMFPFALLEISGRPIGRELALAQLPSLAVAAKLPSGLLVHPTLLRLASVNRAVPHGPQAPLATASQARVNPGGSPPVSRAEAMARLSRADIIQIVAHGRRDSSLEEIEIEVALPSAEDVLTVGTLTRRFLDRRPVVLLGACAALSGKTLELEGTLSPAREFLEAGARAILAAPTDIPDRLMNDVEAQLADGLRGGTSLPEALRRVRADMPVADYVSLGGLTAIGLPETPPMRIGHSRPSYPNN